MPTPDFQRRPPALGSVNHRTHCSQRICHTPHGTLGEAFVAGELGVKRLRRQQAREQAHGSTGIAQVQRAARRLETIDTDAVNADKPRVRPFYGHPHVAERLQGCQAVLAFKEAFHFRDTVGKSTQHDGSVGNGFVARHAYLAGNPAAGLKTERYLFLTVVCHVSLS